MAAKSIGEGQLVHLTFDDRTGTPLENQQLEPDVVQRNDPAEVATGRDQQLEQAVRVLLEEIDGAD